MKELIRKFLPPDKYSCMIAFKSNMPNYFAPDEIDLFSGFLDNFNAKIINGKYFKKTNYFVFIAVDKIVACGGFGYNNETNIVTLAWGLVHRDFHKKGYGKKLLIYRLNQIKKTYPAAHVQIDTTQFSFPFFEKFGFITTKITPDFYAKGMHRYDMVLTKN